MAGSISDLSKTWLFKARMNCGVGEYQAQITWLYDRFKEIEAEGTAEVTAQSFVGQSASFQHRGSTPEDNLAAIQSAIEQLEGTIAGNAKAAHSVPFGFRFTLGPADVLDHVNR